MYCTDNRPDSQRPQVNSISQREVVEASQLLSGAITSLDDAIRQLDVRLTPVAVQVPCNPETVKDPASRFTCSLAQALDQYTQLVNSMVAFVTELDRRVQL